MSRLRWWATWQVWLFFHPPQDRDAVTRWMWGRLGFFLFTIVLEVVTLAAVSLLVLWVGWAWFGW